MRIPSARSAAFTVLIWGIIAVLAASCFFVPAKMLVYVAAGAAIVSALLLWVWFGTFYVFREEDLLLRSGPFFERIPYENITRATKVKSFASSMALSSRMIELTHGERYLSGTTYVSPVDRDAFIEELKKRCSNLKR